MKTVTILLLFLSCACALKAAPPFEDRGLKILSEVISKKWARKLGDASLGETRLVEEKPDLAIRYGLSPVWYAQIEHGGKAIGHVMWDSTGEGRLVEFALDLDLTFKGDSVAVIPGVPAFQQFPIKIGDEKLMASGCVPTSAASLVSYWAGKKFPDWTNGNDDLEAITKRLRARLKMTPYPDIDGFTVNTMALAGASPVTLASAIKADAAAHHVAIRCEFGRFSLAAFKKEIEASRPALVSCRVRVPHKPHLSWGHEVAAVGWALIDEVELVGVLDNFFPTQHPETIRWIRAEAFDSIITVKPKEKE